VKNGRRIAGNLVSLFSGEAVSSALAFVITILLARRLSDEGFGRLAFVQAIMVYLLLAVDLGLSTFGTREIARQPEHLHEIAGQILTMRLLMAGLVAVPLAIGIIFWPMAPAMRWLYWGSLLGLFTQALNPEFIFQGLERMSGVAAWRVLVHFFYLLLIFLLVLGLEELWIVTLLRTIAEAVTLFVLVLWVKQRYGFQFYLKWLPDSWKKFLRESLVMAASVVVIKIYYTFDTFMLGLMDRPEAVGWYQASYKVVLLFIGLAGMVQMAFGPAFARSSKSESLDSTVKLFATAQYIIAIMATSFLVCLNQELIQILFGAGYSESIKCLAILAYSMFFVFIGTIFMAPLLFVGKHKEYLLIVSSGAIVNVVLNLVLIPKFSIDGAAIATTISNISMMLLALKEYHAFSSRKGAISYTVKWVMVFLFFNIVFVRLWGGGIIPFTLTLAFTLVTYALFNLAYIKRFSGELISIFQSLSESRFSIKRK